MSMLEHALDYARRGWPVFPCSPVDKTPMVKRGLHDASCDPDQVRSWWARHPGAMIGAAMGEAAGVFAVDPDAPKEPDDPDGLATWRKLVAEHGCPHTHTHLTPSGGMHVLFAWQPDRPVTNREGQLKGSGINVRGQGGYIIVPPSVRQDGEEYRVAEPLDWFSFAEPPEWLLDMVVPPPSEDWDRQAVAPATSHCAPTRLDRRDRYGSAALQGECERVASAPRGGRNNQLNTSSFRIGQLVGSGTVDASTGRDALLAAATSAGLVKEDGPRAVLATIESGMTSGAGSPRGAPENSADLRGSGGDREKLTITPGAKPSPKAIPLRWHGDGDPYADRPWLVRDLVPERGKGLFAGQWGAGKTFGAIDLSGAVMSGEPFAGKRVVRPGGVLFIAPEGASEIPIRLTGLTEGKLKTAAMTQAVFGERRVDPKRLPFAWIDECPRLLDADAVETLTLTAKDAAEKLRAEFDVPLVLIIVDTIAAGARFDDENAAAETQKVMSALEALSHATGAFVMGVDHFGKMVETGTRGSSAKEAAADVVLAMLADKDTAGTISNTRMAIRKLRGGKVGTEIPYSLEVVEIGRNRDDEPITTCVIGWQIERAASAEAVAPKERWPTSLKVLRAAMTTALIEHGQAVKPFGNEGKEVRAVSEVRVRAEFTASYPADGETPAKKAEAKKKAFQRAFRAARDRELVLSREIGGVDHLWFLDMGDERTIHGTDGTLS